MLQEGRNALIDQKYRWKFPIPYILGDDLGESFFKFELYLYSPYNECCIFK